MLSLLISLVLGTASASPVKWSFNAVPGADGTCWVELNAVVEEGWHIYATQLPSDQGPLPTEIRFTPSDSYQLVDALVEPPAVEEFDPNFSVQVRHHSNTVTFRQRVRPTNAKAEVSGEVEYMVCNDMTCLPPVAVPFTVVLPATEKH